MARSTRFEDKVAVVVGGNAPIGRACARRLRDEGATVLLVDDTPASSYDHDDDLTANFLVADLTTEAGATAVADHCREQWGRLDALVYGVSAIDASWTTPSSGVPDRDDWQRVYDLNVWGPLVYARTLLPLLAESTGGAIVVLASIDAIHGNAAVPLFSSSKGALLTATRVLAHDAAAVSVRINTVATAALLQTRVGDPGPEHGVISFDGLLATTPLPRMPSYDDVSSVVAFFASDDAAYVTGATLPVDGGRTAITPGSLNIAR